MQLLIRKEKSSPRPVNDQRVITSQVTRDRKLPLVEKTGKAASETDRA